MTKSVKTLMVLLMCTAVIFSLNVLIVAEKVLAGEIIGQTSDGKSVEDMTEYLEKDSFNDGDTIGWIVKQGTWSVVTDGTIEAIEGVYSTKNFGDANYAYCGGDNSSNSAKSIFGESRNNYMVEASFKVSTWQTNGKVGLIGRFSDVSNHYFTYYDYASKTVLIVKRVNGSNITLATSDDLGVFSPGTYYKMSMELKDSLLKVYLDGTLIVEATDSNPLSSGYAGLYSKDQQALYDNFRVINIWPRIPQLATGASITGDETVSTNNTFYVDINGDDSNSGNYYSPVRTIKKGVKLATAIKSAGNNAKVIIRDGTYRESVDFPKLIKGIDDTSAVLIVEANNVGNAILSGSDDWSGGWNFDGSNYWKAWTYDWGLGNDHYVTNDQGPVIPTLARRKELVFVNGVQYTQVLSTNDLGSGKFCVDENADKIYIRPASGHVINSALVEISNRNYGIWISNRDNIAIKGLVVQHFTEFVGTSYYDAAVLIDNDSNNVLFKDMNVRYNNVHGFKAASNTAAKDYTFKNVKANYNGFDGVWMGKSENILFEDCKTSGNNIRGLWSDFYSGWAPAGFKLMHTRVSTFRNHEASDNYGRGMWWDTDNSDITVDSAIAKNNYCSGIFVENSYGPALIKNSTITYTKKSSIVTDGFQGGLNISTSKEIGIENCTIQYNCLSQVRIWDTAHREDSIDYKTGNQHWYCVENIKFVSNNLKSNSPDVRMISMPNFDYLKGSWKADSNNYWNTTLSCLNMFAIGNYGDQIFYNYDGWSAIIDDKNATITQ